MPLKPSRRFVISDAMVVIAAAAGGTALIRAISLDDIVRLLSDRNGAYEPGLRNILLIQSALSYVLPFLAAWTPALLFLRLRQPRPRLGRVFKQPGTVACVVATLAMAIEAVWLLPLLAVGSRSLPPHVDSLLVVHFSHEVSFAVAGGWSALALSGRWRPEPSWIDLAGRITGAVWLAVTAVSWTSAFLR